MTAQSSYTLPRYFHQQRGVCLSTVAVEGIVMSYGFCGSTGTRMWGASRNTGEVKDKEVN